MNAPLWRRALSFGSGVGIQLGPEDLEIAVVQMRPNGARLAGAHRVENYRERPAAEWGAEALAFLKKLGADRQAAIAVLPRRDAILRILTLPGLSQEDTAAAVRFQLDTLHPYGEDDVLHDWRRVNASTVVVGIAEQRVVDAAAGMLAEAGIRLAGVSFSGPVLHEALRMTGTPAAGMLAMWPAAPAGVECYGESPARPLFSSEFDLPPERAAALVRAELRVEAEIECVGPLELLPWLPRGEAEADGQEPAPALNILAPAAALAASCPHLGQPLNLLPESRRAVSSRARYIPTLVLAVLAALTGGALLAQEAWLDSSYLARLQQEIKRIEPSVARVQALDAETASLSDRIRVLDTFRRQSQADLEVIREVNQLVPPPGWIQQLQISRGSVQIAGEAEGAEELLKKFDESPLFRGAAFTMPLTRGAQGEQFRLRVEREEAAR
jgi:hypothetical protein